MLCSHLLIDFRHNGLLFRVLLLCPSHQQSRPGAGGTAQGDQLSHRLARFLRVREGMGVLLEDADIIMSMENVETGLKILLPVPFQRLAGMAEHGDLHVHAAVSAKSRKQCWHIVEIGVAVADE